jgi:hypothetical protein
MMATIESSEDQPKKETKPSHPNPLAPTQN